MPVLTGQRSRDLQLAEGPRYTIQPLETDARPSSGLEVSLQWCQTVCLLWVVSFNQACTALQTLPESTLRQLLALLPLSQRIKTAELVSKHWRQALRDQEVLSVVDFSRDPLWWNKVRTAYFLTLCTSATLVSPHPTVSELCSAVDFRSARTYLIISSYGV